MTTLSERIEAARAAGFSDDQIRSRITLAPEFAEAKAKGFSDEQIFSHLGFESTKANAQGKAAGNNAAQAKPQGNDASASSPLVSNPLVRYPAMVGSGITKGVAKGVGLLGDLEGAGLALGERFLPEWMTRPIAGGEKEAGRLLPNSNELTRLTAKAGLTDVSELAPQGRGEHMLNAGSEGLGSAVPFLLSPGSKVVTLAAGAAGGLGGEVAHEMFPKSEVAPIIGGLVGGTGVQIAHSVLAQSQVLQAAKRLGTSATMQEAGEFAQQTARDWRAQVMPAKIDAVWRPVDAQMHGAATPLTNFETTLSDMATKAGSLQGVAEAVGGQAPKKILGELNKTMSALGSAPTWDDVKALRTFLGDAKANPKVVKDISAQQIDGLYKAITQDMEASAKAVSPTALELFQAANKESSRIYQFAEKTIGKIIAGATESSKDALPENVAVKLLGAGRKGASDLAALRAEMPEVVDELGAAFLRSPKLEWGKLAPEAKEALVVDKGLRSAVERAAKAAMARPSDHGTNLLAALVGEETSKYIATELNKHFNQGNELVSPEGAALAGAIVPSLARGARNIAGNPLLLQGPAIGAVAGNAAGR